MQKLRLCAVGVLASSALWAQGGFTEFPLPTPNALPGLIISGPDGNLWFTETTTNKIGRITPNGTIMEFPIPGAGNIGALGIAAGPDGNVWFTQPQLSEIARITPAGTITEFSVPDLCAVDLTQCGPAGITAGPDGNLWFTRPGPASTFNFIGKMTTSGVVTLFPVSAYVGESITAGPDGNLWFTAETFSLQGAIGRITTSGSVTMFGGGSPPVPGWVPVQITRGPDGNLWFTETGGIIGRISTTGAVKEFFPVFPAINGTPDITSGPDGNLWFTFINSNQIVKMSPNAATIPGSPTPAATYSIPTAAAEPWGIVTGTDGNLWFTERNANKIGRFTIAASPTPTPLPPSLLLAMLGLAGIGTAGWLRSKRGTPADSQFLGRMFKSYSAHWRHLT
jgi:sugar lactone lactonase YvrE